MLTKSGVKVLDFGLATMQERRRRCNVPLDRRRSAAKRSRLRADAAGHGPLHGARAARGSRRRRARRPVRVRRSHVRDGHRAARVRRQQRRPASSPPSCRRIPRRRRRCARPCRRPSTGSSRKRWPRTRTTDGTQPATSSKCCAGWRAAWSAAAGCARRTMAAARLACSLLCSPLSAFGAYRGFRPDRRRAAVADVLDLSAGDAAGSRRRTSPCQSPQFALSPDGRRLVFVASVGHEPSQLWLRDLHSLKPEPMPRHAGRRYPFWSPDSESIGFFANGSLKRIDLAGGPARVLAAALNGRGGAWSRDGTIVFAPSDAERALSECMPRAARRHR